MPTKRRSRLVTVLAVLLALESVTVVAARAAEIRDARLTAADAAPRAVVQASGGRPTPRRLPGAIAGARANLADSLDALPAGAGVSPVDVGPGPASHEVESAPAAKPRPGLAAGSPTKVTATPRQGSSPDVAAPAFRGRNRVWSPAFGIDKAIHFFPCTRSEYPGNVVYRWGCAGRNNVYLFGHAANVFAGLNRAYYAGTLKAGQKVYYADATGKVRTYSVRWWKVVYPTPDVDWAWASLGRPSMTLQTCVGAKSEKRLMVRLVQVAG